MLNQDFMSLGAGRFNIRALIAIACLIFFPGCAGIPVQPPPPPFSHQKIAQILYEIREQENKADTFFSTGKLMIKGEAPESESDILIVGSHSPFRVKIEVTHPWGRPILHILANETNLHILSFPEKRYYVGSLGNSVPSRLFPNSLEPDQLWSLLRGFPILRKNDQAVSLKGNQIMLLNQDAEIVQIIDFFPQSNLPRLITFPERSTKIYFSNYQKENNICYAREIRLSDPESANDLSINLKQMVFNKPIPEAIYNLEKPADFKTLPLN
jgi:hypothetical protein